MAFCSSSTVSFVCKVKVCKSSPLPSASRSFPCRLNLNPNLNLRRSIRAISTQAAPAPAPAIALTDNALKHLNKMRSEKNEDLCLRIGVKQGGCSGMSYSMEFESKENTRPDDTVMEYNGFVIVLLKKEGVDGVNYVLWSNPLVRFNPITTVCDPKSLLFIFGMQLDFSDALIGGGFSFKNPNATQTCGCGKSFAAEM